VFYSQSESRKLEGWWSQEWFEGFELPHPGHFLLWPSPLHKNNEKIGDLPGGRVICKFVVSRVGCLGCYRFQILWISRNTRMMTEIRRRRCTNIYNGDLFTAIILQYSSSSTALVFCVRTPKTSLAVSSHTHTHTVSSLARCQGPRPGRWPNCPGCHP